MKKIQIAKKIQEYSQKKQYLKTQNIEKQKNQLITKSSKDSQLNPNKNQKKYRNKNLIEIPIPLLNCLSTLTSVDISYNQLNDSQIQLLINNCIKLKTLCINNNYNQLIPAAIWKLKYLQFFKHDWLNICYQNIENFQSESNLNKLQKLVQKPQIVVKINRVVGINFQSYCSELTKVTFNQNLLQKIKTSNCTKYSKQLMLKTVTNIQNSSKLAQTLKVKPIIQKQQFLISCKSMCQFQQNPKKKQNNIIILNKQQNLFLNILKEQSQTQTTDCGSHKIKIQDIRQITQIQQTIPQNQNHIHYHAPGYPLHQLFANFKDNKNILVQIDKLLLTGYNPNQYDKKGLSPYHVCIIKNQKKCLQYLMNISIKNPGFFDLQMPQKNQGRNILHYCVFLKNYHFTKLLIQFGFPLFKRDSYGARIIHLVDQNYQFILLLRKMIKKIISTTKNKHHTCNLCQKKYQQHPQRIVQQSKLRIVQNRNTQLLDMFQSVVGRGKAIKIK